MQLLVNFKEISQLKYFETQETIEFTLNAVAIQMEDLFSVNISSCCTLHYQPLVSFC